MATNVRSRVIGQQVFVLVDDIIKDLYVHLSGDSTEEQKKYMRAQIELWELYAADIQKQAEQKQSKSWF